MKNKFLFIVATHGDEGFSLNILKNIELKYPKKKFGYDWVIGNPAALAKKVRFISTDLNRCAPGNLTSQVYEKKRAAEIVKMSENYDFVIDVHGSTSECGILAIITNPTLDNLSLSQKVGIGRNVIWYARSSLNEGPITQFVKCPAIEIECGPKNDKNIQKKLANILKDLTLMTFNNGYSKKSRTVRNKSEFYVVYGKKIGSQNQDIIDFKQVKIDGESFYPFMANQYPNILCYKTKRVDIKDYFLY